MSLPESQCEHCKKILKAYAKILGYTVKDVDEKLPFHKPRKTWITTGKGGSQVVTHYFQCLRCYPLTKKGWKIVDRSMDVREIGGMKRILGETKYD